MTADQFTTLQHTDFDVLAVLDACRWDYWDREYSRGHAVRSPASCTRNWVGALVDAFDTERWTCVTANPIHERHYDGAFGERVDVWRTSWRQFNGIPTVGPQDTTEAAKPYFGQDAPLYIHYLPPHGPYPHGPTPVPVMRANPEANAVDIADDDVPDHLIRDPMRLIHADDTWLTARLLRKAYTRNLQWVYDALLPLLRSELAVVVTADHGEFLADGPGDGRYGHPCHSDHALLREVPLWVP